MFMLQKYLSHAKYICKYEVDFQDVLDFAELVYQV